MDEGVDCDDKYRMVEDEFLTIAKRFTVHLHAAEYKRQQKMVKSRNADTINSISRPVTGKMPDHTKRKVETAARVKTQKVALESMLGKKAEDGSDDSDDGDGLPYFGTTLHGLMDSPRKKAASLARLGTIAATTRAAAGFKQSAAQVKPYRKGNQESPQSKVAFRTAKVAQPRDDVPTGSSEDDNDLDALIPAPKLTALDRKPVSSYSSSSSREVNSTTYHSTYSTKSFPPTRRDVSVAAISTGSNSFSADGYTPGSPEIRSRPSRLEQARRQKARKEKEQQGKKGLDVIPTFL
jgi:hypothetical protein